MEIVGSGASKHWWCIIYEAAKINLNGAFAGQYICSKFSMKLSYLFTQLFVCLFHFELCLIKSTVVEQPLECNEQISGIQYQSI